MLHEVAASDLDITHIVSPLRTLLRQTAIFVGDVAGIDLAARTVRVSHGFEAHEHVLAFDHVVLALGSTASFHGLPGLEGRALTMKTLADAIHLRNRVIATLEQADAECADTPERLLTFVVAGGGFAGVETMGALSDFVRDAIRFYPRLQSHAVRMVLVHSGETILPELGPELGAYAGRKLRARGIDVITGARVAAVTAAGVELSDGRRLPSTLIVWTAGTAPNPLLAQIGCPTDHGRVAVDATLAVSGHPGVWALGDCAAVPDSRTGGQHPPTAQHAIRQATTLARNIVGSLRGEGAVAFDFRTLGQLAAIGRRTGVARILGINFSGFVAWWLWRTVYLGKLPRIEKKVRVALDWTLDLIFSKDFVQFQTEK
jgi:NADH:ubiquinone reductase (H+-translocating)